MSQRREPTIKICPECGAEIVSTPGYVTWCPACNWNLQPKPPAPTKNFFKSTYERLGKRASQRLFESLANCQALKPTFTPSTALALVIALAVHLLNIGFVFLGAWLIIRH